MLYVHDLQRDEVGHYTEVGQTGADECSQALASGLRGSGPSPSPCHKPKWNHTSGFDRACSAVGLDQEAMATVPEVPLRVLP